MSGEARSAAVRAALVTGGASGIGFEIARVMKQRGWEIYLLDRNAATLAEARAAFGLDESRAFACGVSDEAAVEDAIARIGAAHTLGAVVNSAGVGMDKPALETTVQDFQRILDVNLIGTFIPARAAARRWIERGEGGAIVNISSVSGLTGSKGRAAYGSSKGAVNVLTQILSTEFAPHGIRVNAIAPGAVDTPMAREHHTPDVRRQWHERIPQGRYGLAREIATAAAFLASEDAAYVTGQVLAVDGGFLTAGLTNRKST